MDSSEWTKLQPQIKIENTRKKFYNRYLYKITYNLKGAKIFSSIQSADYSKDDLDDFLASYKLRRRWSNRLFMMRLDEVYDFYQIRINRSIKTRVESDSFSVYSSSLDLLYKIANDDLKEYRHILTHVSLVSDDKRLELLEKGCIINQRPATYPYKLHIKEGRFDDTEKKNLVNYLRNLGEEIRIGKNLLDSLDAEHKYFRGGYVYVKDPRLVDLLKFVSPNLISKCYQIVNQ